MTNQNVIENQNPQHTCQGKCPDTLCWNCRYATGTKLPKPLALTSRKTGKKHVFHGCPWATKSIAVPGWEAEKTVVYNQEVHGGPLPSYLVKTCPHYEYDGNEEPTIEEIIEVLNLPVRFALSNRFILWDYYTIYKMFIKQAQKTKGKELSPEVILDIKIAATKALVEDLEWELNQGDFTEEEYDKKVAQVDELVVVLRRRHTKQYGETITK